MSAGGELFLRDPASPDIEGPELGCPGVLEGDDEVEGIGPEGQLNVGGRGVGLGMGVGMVDAQELPPLLLYLIEELIELLWVQAVAGGALQGVAGGIDPEDLGALPRQEAAAFLRGLPAGMVHHLLGQALFQKEQTVLKRGLAAP